MNFEDFLWTLFWVKEFLFFVYSSAIISGLFVLR